MMKHLQCLLLLCCCLLCACDREELPVPAHDAGDVVTSSVDLGADYRWQFYWDLKTLRVVSQNRKTAWDLGFECTASGYHVVLNGSKAMYAWPTGATDLAAVIDTIGLGDGKRWDVPSGNLDSTAVGDWRGAPQVYVIDRGYSETGSHQGFRKIMLQAVDAASFTLRYAALDGSGDTTVVIPKDSTYNLTFFSFAAGGSVVTIEPPKHDWDISFTQYLEILPERYLVTGVLLNRFQTTAVMDSSLDFAAIDYDYAASLPRQSDLNTIGYAWKYYDFGAATYEVLSEMNYIVQDREGLLYKLHFIDFYDQQGIKGSPKWESQQL